MDYWVIALGVFLLIGTGVMAMFLEVFRESGLHDFGFGVCLAMLIPFGLGGVFGIVSGLFPGLFQ
jgi:hypothetical protein